MVRDEDQSERGNMIGPSAALLRAVQDGVRRVPGSFVASSIEATVLLGMGVGVIAKEHIPKDALVFQATHDVWYPFSAEFALHEAQQKAPGFVKQLDALMATAPSLGDRSSFVPNALVLGTHLAMSIDGAADDSTLHDAYLQSLPEFVDLPFYWDAHQFEALDACHEVRQSIQQSAHFYFQLYQHLFGAVNQFVPAEKYFWSISVLMSRATSGKGQPFTLIPFFDWFNHADNGDECVQEYDAQKGFVVHTTREYAPGEQLFINYGSHGNARLLRNYGFTTPNNPHDTATLALPGELQTLDPQDTTSADKATLLKAIRLMPTQKTVTVLASGVLSPQSYQWLQLRLADSGEFAAMVQQAMNAVQAKDSLPDLIAPASLEQKIQTEFRQLCTARLKQHRHSIQHDEDFLATNSGAMAAWLRGAMEIRLSEKKILRSASQAALNGSAE